MELAERIYYAKKLFALFPGTRRAVSAPAFAEHFRRRDASRSAGRALLDFVLGHAFLSWTAWRARKVAQKFGKGEDWRRNAVRIARERFVDPNDLALFGIENAAQLDSYIRRFEDAAFNKIVNPSGWTRACVLADKVKFYRRCEEAGLPHPQVVALIERGRAVRFDLPAPFALICKPGHGEGGRGVVAVPDVLARVDDARAFARGLIALAGSAGPVWIVQRRLANHPALAEYALDALATARITTMLDEAGRPELVNAVLRLPTRPGSLIDNMKADGLIMPLSLDEGRAGHGCKGYSGDHVAHHPVTGALLEALVLPDWAAAVLLACSAHARAFGEYSLIGWDMAFTPDGPVLVEGNSKPGVLMPQRSWRRGLADQRYGELLAFNLARMEQAARRR